jgi:hypothetical protein
MKTQRSLQVLLVGLLVVLLYGCATYPRSGPAALVGTWTNSLGTVWTLGPDGTFSVDLNHDGQRDAWGTYTVKADTVTIHGTGGTIPNDCKGNAPIVSTAPPLTRCISRSSKIAANCALKT